MNRTDEGQYVLELTLTYLQPREGSNYPTQDTLHRVVYRTTCADGEMRFRRAAAAVVPAELDPRP